VRRLRGLLAGLMGRGATRWGAAGALLVGAIAAVFVLDGTIRTSPAQAESRIELSPASGPGGTVVTLSGRGFGGRRRIAVSVGRRTVRRFRAGERGSFNIKLRLSLPQAEGRVPVTVRSGRRRVVARFEPTRRQPSTVVAEAASSAGTHLRWAREVRAGRSFGISGYGFGRRRRLRVEGPGAVARPRTGRRGGFAARLRSSRAFPGPRELVVSARALRTWTVPVRVLTPGALLGAYVNPDTSDGQSRDEVNRFEALIGRRLAVSHTYRRWASGFTLRSEGEADEGWLAAGGRIPMISHGDGGYPAGRNLLDEINRGDEDGVIVRAARAFRRFGRPLLYRLLWEMNGDWNTYNVTSASTPGTQDGTAKFVRAWRRIHRIFRREGAVNAAFVWCPNATNRPDTAANHWRRYYPGDAYVDWACADGYNRGGRRWQTFEEIFTPIHDDFPRKPFMIGETGSVEAGGDKAAWIERARVYMQARLTRAEAFLWFHRGHDPQENGTDWRVDTSSGALDAFRALAADPYFNP
jgi:hypothetical protein